MMETCVIEFSFTITNEDDLEKLGSLHDTLLLCTGRSLKLVAMLYYYDELVPQLLDSDVLTKVNTIRISRKNGAFSAFFSVTTETYDPHFDLWTNITKQISPAAQLDAIGSITDGKRICQKIYPQT